MEFGRGWDAFFLLRPRFLKETVSEMSWFHSFTHSLIGLLGALKKNKTKSKQTNKTTLRGPDLASLKLTEFVASREFSVWSHHFCLFIKLFVHHRLLARSPFARYQAVLVNGPGKPETELGKGLE